MQYVIPDMHLLPLISATCITKKKRKIGRPPGGHTNLEQGQKKPHKRRRKKRFGLITKKRDPSALNAAAAAKSASSVGQVGDDAFNGDSNSTGSLEAQLDLDQGFDDDDLEAFLATGNGRKRKYTRHKAPPLEMKTRGVKMRRYSFEPRTHQKIVRNQQAAQRMGRAAMQQFPQQQNIATGKHKSAFKVRNIHEGMFEFFTA